MTLSARSATTASAALFAGALVLLPLDQVASAEPSAEIRTELAPESPLIASPLIASPLIADTAESAAQPQPAINGTELECVAKVVHHEAGNQSRAGQMAVAHVMLNRTRSGKFPSNVCAVANQPRQFFNLANYNPRLDTAQWRSAVEVARAALSGETEDTSKGAMFFHAAYARPDSFFRTRTRVVQLEDHIFYR
jgi:spore germination cell wall hydrolase CwlJ-like protein